MTTSEVDALESDNTPSGEVELTNGLKVQVNRLKTRETMKLLKILTRGASYALSTLDLKSDPAEFAESLVVSVVFAIPEAEEETIDFIRAMVSPVELIDNPKSKAEKEVNQGILDQLEEALSNPELEDLVNIVTAIVQVEAPHIQALGKTLGLLLKTYRPEKS